mmetsp:Transcript_19587/g.30690  ORF Transcript_19587/g.30690 Transcript_19587/m.30690 type:complete len:127 (-) Transcript_19587:44-424(-)
MSLTQLGCLSPCMMQISLSTIFWSKCVELLSMLLMATLALVGACTPAFTQLNVPFPRVLPTWNSSNDCGLIAFSGLTLVAEAAQPILLGAAPQPKLTQLQPEAPLPLNPSQLSQLSSPRSLSDSVS